MDKKIYTDADRNIILTSASNVRDLGGYRTDNNKTTKFKKFVRSAGLHRITEEDKKKLLNYNIKTIIDLRSHGEVKINPTPKLSDDVKYYNVEIGNVFIENSKKYKLDYDDLTTFYILMIMDRKKYIKKVFDIILEHHNRGAILFHCTAGKDRTGIIAAMILLISKVPVDIVLEDYSKSYNNLKSILDRIIEESSPSVKPEGFLSEPKTMNTFIDYMLKQFGSVEKFLKDTGLNDSEILELSSIL